VCLACRSAGFVHPLIDGRSPLHLAAAAVRLPDGRRLACTAIGPRDGLPVVQLHGAIGTPLRPCATTDAALTAAGVRLILPQRPGFGDSDPHPGRTLCDWPADLAVLADALGLERFAVLGVSAGGPYAAASARAMPDRVVVTAITSGTVPLWGPDARPASTPLLRLGAHTVRRPRTSRVVSRGVVRAVRARPDLLLGLVSRRSAAADRTHLTPERRSAMVDGVLEAIAGGPECILDDVRIALGPWGFAPAEVAGEVQVWHGARDATVPVADALAVAGAIPGARTTVLMQEGHFFLRAHLAQVLAGITAAWPGGARRRPPVAA